MARIALGWLGWTADDLLTADVNVVLAAFDGRKTMIGFAAKTLLEMAFGTGGPPAPAAGSKLPPITPKVFDSIFKGAPRHSRRRRR